MGVSLGYVSSSPVDGQTKAAIRADADTANDSHTWWCWPAPQNLIHVL